MDLSIDRYAALQSPIHRWEARCRLMGLLSLIIACATVSHIALLPVAVVLAAGCYVAARLPLSFLLTRLRYPAFFLLAVVAVLPFVSGQTALAHLGPLTLYQEGCTQALLTAARFGCILTLSLVLFSAAPLLTTVRTMQALGLPGLLVDLMLFFFRYLSDTADLLARRQRALRLRGLPMQRLSGRLLGALAAITGSMLVQSYERSERIYHAMRIRGYGQAPAAAHTTPIRAADWLGLAVALTVAVLLIAASLLPG